VNEAASLPTLSVVVPVHDAAGVLERTVPAMMAQQHPAHWVFVDDGSADGSADLVERLVQANPPAAIGATVRVIRHETNRGRASARNTGRAHAHDDVVVFLDADMAPAPDFLTVHAGIHARPGVIGAVSPETWGDLDLSDPYHLYLARYRRGPTSLQPGQPVPARLFVIGYTSVRRTALDEVGGFDEGIPYGEDTDLAVRLVERYPEGLRYAEAARVVQFGAPRLDAALRKWRRFGRASVPLLLSRHPSLARDLGGDLAQAGSLRAALASVVLRDPLASAARRALPVVPRLLRPLVVRYLVAEAIVSGYRASLRAGSPLVEAAL
jgi:glycosyltransferase involved in cell wall biosynthesis